MRPICHQIKIHGPIYNITVTASDMTRNHSDAQIDITMPHDNDNEKDGLKGCGKQSEESGKCKKSEKPSRKSDKGKDHKKSKKSKRAKRSG